MPQYGPTTVGNQIGTSIEVVIDGRPKQKIGGITIDWTTVAAVGSNTTWLDGVFLSAATSDKGLRYGQVIVLITASGLYGPYDFAAADGRQALANGKAFFLNRSILANDPVDMPEACYGGMCAADRLLITTGTHSLAAGPTVTEFLAAFPDVQLVYAT
jgi:hypothetical protein